MSAFEITQFPIYCNLFIVKANLMFQKDVVNAGRILEGFGVQRKIWTKKYSCELQITFNSYVLILKFQKDEV